MILTKFQENVILSDFTTIKTGGPARLFIKSGSKKDIVDSVNYALEKELDYFLLGGGSNVIIADEGFDGIVIKVENKGVSIEEETQDKVKIKILSGSNWDSFVKFAVRNGYSGIECMAGIPGTAGASLINNIGAYGQEISEVLDSAYVYDTETLSFHTLRKDLCDFQYRDSIFKNNNRYVILSISIILNKNGIPSLKYDDLVKYFGDLSGEKPNVYDVYNAVIKIRKSKSMYIDEADSNTLSVGSFFTNPILDSGTFEKIKSYDKDVPFWPTDNGYKVSAGWIIERVGYYKGFTSGNVGLSDNHALAIVNKNKASASEIVDFARMIRDTVIAEFNIKLIPEPVFVGFHKDFEF